MIFKEIVLHNFGIYKGRHTVDLRPHSDTKPIILFGGLNGGGKTTFLDALQLTLYGKSAKCSNRGDLTYNDYLRETINRYVNPGEGAALELEFSHYSEGTETTYRIKRLWKSTGKGLKETMEVLKNGQYDPIMSDQWYEYVDEFIPGNISGLFFFDGEKIESLANPESSAEIIETGIMSLLGLDLVDKLNDDLSTIERRRRKKNVNLKDAKTIAEVELAIRDLKGKDQRNKDTLASKLSELDSLECQITNAERNYKKHGGALFEQRELIQGERNHLEQALKGIKDNISKFAEGAAPLSLVQSLITKAQNQSKKEKKTFIDKELVDTLAERDLDIVNKFSKQLKEPSAVSLLEELFAKDIVKRKVSAQQNTSLNTRPEILAPFNKEFFARIGDDSRQLNEEYEKISEKLAHCEKKISTIPDEDMIKEVAEQLQAAENQHKIVQGELKTLQAIAGENAKMVSSKQAEVDRLLHNTNDEQLSAHKDQRVLQHAEQVKETLILYRRALIEKHIGRLEQLIQESFRALLRKSDLVKCIQINPNDFSLNVISNENEVIPAKRLSAGERQLLAISILWGLAKASGRPLPSIIDTPLGRLDSEHRGLLIKNYFPNASHQVILLSTDTEIDQEYRDALSKNIGKEYHIQYQEQLQSSTITAGYF